MIAILPETSSVGSLSSVVKIVSVIETGDGVEIIRPKFLEKLMQVTCPVLLTAVCKSEELSRAERVRCCSAVAVLLLLLCCCCLGAIALLLLVGKQGCSVALMPFAAASLRSIFQGYNRRLYPQEQTSSCAYLIVSAIQRRCVLEA